MKFRQLTFRKIIFRAIAASVVIHAFFFVGMSMAKPMKRRPEDLVFVEIRRTPGVIKAEEPPPQLPPAPSKVLGAGAGAQGGTAGSAGNPDERPQDAPAAGAATGAIGPPSPIPVMHNAAGGGPVDVAVVSGGGAGGVGDSTYGHGGVAEQGSGGGGGGGGRGGASPTGSHDPPIGNSLPPLFVGGPSLGAGPAPAGAGSPAGGGSATTSSNTPSPTKPTTPTPQPTNPDGTPATMICGGKSVTVNTDLAHCGGCDKPCKPGQKCKSGVCTGGSNNQYAVNRIRFPDTDDQYAIDVNGDGKIDNRFARFLAGMKGYMKGAGYPNGLQDNLDGLLGWGQLVLLLDMPPAKSFEPITLFRGQWDGPPKDGDPRVTWPLFDGHDIFSVGDAAQKTTFYGSRQGDSFIANAAPGREPPLLPIQIELKELGTRFTIPFRCHRIQLKFTEGDTEILGELQGTLKRTDLEQKLGVDVADYINEELKSPDPAVVRLARAALLLFDTGGANGNQCENPKGVKRPLGEKGDDRLDPCEVLEDEALSPGLAPDMECYPQVPGTNDMLLTNFSCAQHIKTPDSISFGLAFTAVRASF